MNKDRTEIVKILEHMFEGEDDSGIYPTSTAYARLENYIQQERNMAIGCTHAQCCIELDKGNDPRIIESSNLFEEINESLI